MLFACKQLELMSTAKKRSKVFHIMYVGLLYLCILCAYNFGITGQLE